MNDPADPVDPDFAIQLASYDEALATGTPLPDAGTLPERVIKARQCLDLLERVWPRRTSADRPGEPASAPLQLGRFRVTREVGRGGYGIVYLAVDPVLNRTVALKVPRPEALLTPTLRRRFLREAQTAAGLDHPNIVRVFEAGEDGAICYIASAYCPGPTMAAWLRSRSELAPPHLTARLIADLAAAVQHAHDRGVLHRDLKPTNILLDGGPAPDALVPRLTDFGLAKVVDEGGDDTRTGVLLGTPAYMAPEQAESRLADIGPHTDVYALGAILYELLTDRPPFKGTSALDTLEQVRTEDPVAPGTLHPRLPRDLETICLKCLSKEPGRRYGSPRELAEDLGRFLRHEPIRARPPGPLVQFALWSRRPERIRDAGMYMIAVGLAFVTMHWAFWLAGFVFHVMPVERPTEALWYVARFHLFIDLPLVCAGVRVSPHRSWPLWVGLVVMAGFSLLILNDLAGMPVDFGGWIDYENGGGMKAYSERLAANVLGITFTGLGAIFCAFGLYARSFVQSGPKDGAVGI